jgi:flagellar biogenesis protein FliO
MSYIRQGQSYLIQLMVVYMATLLLLIICINFWRFNKSGLSRHPGSQSILCRIEQLHPYHMTGNQQRIHVVDVDQLLLVVYISSSKHVCSLLHGIFTKWQHAGVMWS